MIIHIVGDAKNHLFIMPNLHGILKLLNIKRIINCNKSINWYPSYVGEKRFNNWLEGMVDWGISRNRYWGCPMPIWTCDCNHIDVLVL